MDLNNDQSKKYQKKTPQEVKQLQSLSMLLSDGERVEIKVDEGFFLITEAGSFIMEVKIHAGTIKRNCS